MSEEGFGAGCVVLAEIYQPARNGCVRQWSAEMSRTGRWCVGLFIGCYLSILTLGIVAHSLKIGLSGNTLSYYVVWDMFCGWNAYDQRTHLIAESESGRYYEVSEPWEAFRPYGKLGRIQYDVYNHMVSKHIDHILSHTKHEPVNRVFVVQEFWPKQYNLPESLWKQNFGRERDKLSYYHLRAVCNNEGRFVNNYPDWLNQQQMNAVGDNPRLRHEVQQARASFGTWSIPTDSTSGMQEQNTAILMPSTN